MAAVELFDGYETGVMPSRDGKSEPIGSLFITGNGVDDPHDSINPTNLNARRQENYVSASSYNVTIRIKIHGF